MKPTVSKDALVAHLDREVVLLHAVTKDYFRLNETGQAIWRLIEEGRDVDGIIAGVLGAFEVEREVARAEVTRLLDELRDAGLLLWVE
jgi:hypothetical protein